MITKIFYSLVIFPYLQYGSDFFGYFLQEIREIHIGAIELIFLSKRGEIAKVIFQHASFLGDLYEERQLNNWYVKSESDWLSQKIIEVYKDADVGRDFNFFNDKMDNRNIPFGVVLTITTKCNIFCYYCFNDIDYELKSRNTRENYDLGYWKNIVNHLYKNGTRVVILTGGEPMVAPFFWELLDYLKEKNIFVHINTNGTLLSDKNLKRLHEDYSVNLMVSMHEFNDKDFLEVNKEGLKKTFGVSKISDSFKMAFSNKVTQLRKIKDYKNLSLEFLTILVWKNILYLDKIYQWAIIESGIEFHNWQFFRLYSTHNNIGASQQMMSLAVNKIYILNKKYNTNFKIVDPVPFCVSKNIERSQEVIDGVLSDTHDVKTIITTEGYVQMMSAYDNNFWNLNDGISIHEIFQSDFVKKQLNNGFLPKECRDCIYRETCKGGSRMDANIAYGSYSAFDPIGNIHNKVTNA